jgi:diguanylate cyclase (GGDEF)-like protein
VGKPFLDLVPESGRAAVVENLKVHLSGTNGFVQIEMSLCARDGGNVDVLINASAAIFEGQPASLGVEIDISARKQMEVALRTSEAKYANALKIMNAGDWEYDFLTDRFTFSDNFYHLFRTTAAAVGGHTMSSAEYAGRFVHPDDRDLVGAEVKAAIETTDPNFSRAFEHRMLYADGTPGYIAVRIFIVKDKAGRTIRSYGVNQDVTKRKEAELALAASEMTLQAALSNMSQGLLMLNAEARVVLFNPSFAKIFKMPPEKITPGMSTPDLMMLAFETSGLKDIDPERTLAEQTRVLSQPSGGSYLQQLNDGRSVVAAYQPLPNGGIVATFEDITQRLLAEEKIKHLAQYDALTNLPNRVTFYEQMETILKRVRRSELVGVLSLDLDHFKAVNDTLGHPIGDLLLQAAAQRMQSCLREGDIVARLGGDEFAILQVPARQPAEITALATRLIEIVGAPYDLDRRQVIVGVSVGIAIAPGDGSEPDTLLKNADLALYRAKADGGGVYRFFEPEMDARMQARRVIELDLRKAMRNGGSSNCSISPSSTSRRGRSPAARRWCAGTIRNAASSCPRSSFRSRRPPA